MALLNEFSLPPEAISHKQLTSLLAGAPKEIVMTNEETSLLSKEEEIFEELIKNWSCLSKELLATLNKKPNCLFANREKKSIMALGALEAHLHLALQAQKES